MRMARIRKSRSVGKSEAMARACRVCGCTDCQACEGGCWWVAADLCSSCADNSSNEPKEAGSRAAERTKPNRRQSAASLTRKA